MRDRLKTDLYTIWDRGRHGISWEDSWVQDFVDDIASDPAAARRFLALTETGQRIEWCETHDSPSVDESNEPWCDEAMFQDWIHIHRDGTKPDPCSIVPKLLADYLTEEDR